MDSLTDETVVNDSLLEEYKLIHQLYAQENELLILENRKLREKMAGKEDVIYDKDKQIENLIKEIDDLKRYIRFCNLLGKI